MISCIVFVVAFNTNKQCRSSAMFWCIQIVLGMNYLKHMASGIKVYIYVTQIIFFSLSLGWNPIYFLISILKNPFIGRSLFLKPQTFQYTGKQYKTVFFLQFRITPVEGPCVEGVPLVDWYNSLKEFFWQYSLAARYLGSNNKI